MVAYLAALHEHCAGLLQFGGPEDCASSIRCVYLQPNGTAQASTSSSDGNVIWLTAANTSGIAGSAGAGTSSSEASRAAATAAQWKSVAYALNLTQPICLPVPGRFKWLRYRVCSQARGQQNEPSDLAVEEVAGLCRADPASCFMRDGGNSADFNAWWAGTVPERNLEDSSSWKAAGSIQRAGETCEAAWASKGKRVSDSCATRGIGTAPWNNSLMLNRLIVAVVDAYESSACNNTVTFSEAMAVEKIVNDLCVGSGCRAQQARASGGAGGLARVAPWLAAVLAVLWLAGVMM
jgi:hypothetical protein